MSMSRKHYEAIAEVLNRAQERDMPLDFNSPRVAVIWTAADVLSTITKQLADVFQADNPAFDRERFLKACGL